MAQKKENQAYDLSLFEENNDIQMSSADKKSRKKKKSGQIISISQGSSSKAQRRKRNPLVIFFVGLLTIVLASVAILFVHFNAELNEINDSITEKNKELTELQNLQARYQLEIDSKLTDSYVRNYAETELNMTPAKNAQKKFFSLSDGDKGEVVEDDSSGNVFTVILDAFSKAFM